MQKKGRFAAQEKEKAEYSLPKQPLAIANEITSM